MESKLSIEQQANELNPDRLWLMPYLIVLATSLALAAGNIYMPSLPQMAHYFECDTSTLLISISIFYAGFASSGIIYGALADYFGRRLTLLYGFATFLLGATMCLVSVKLWMFMLGSLLEGIGGASALIVGLATIQDMYTAEKSVKTLGWTGALLVIMPSLSPILGGYLSTAGWRTNYLLITILSSLLFILLNNFFVETHKESNRQSGTIKRFFLSYFTVIKHTGFLRYASIYPVLVMGSTALLTAMPIYLMEKLGFDSKTCGYFIGFMTIGYAFGSIAASKLVTHYGIKITLKFGLLLSLVSSMMLVVCCMLNGKNLAFLIAAFFLQSGMAIAHPPSTTTAIRYFSDLRASASAVRGTFSVLGSAIGAAIASYIGGFNILSIAVVTVIASSIALLLSLVSSNNNRLYFLSNRKR